nr:MAG TPA: hypothetical protein [Caudoviricetes sp.]
MVNNFQFIHHAFYFFKFVHVTYMYTISVAKL